MGSDFYMNPPTDQCKVCKGWSESVHYKRKTCDGCYLKALKRALRRAVKELERLRTADLDVIKEGKVALR